MAGTQLDLLGSLLFIIMLQKRDLVWLLAYPIYQTIGTFRHEGSHALVAILEGAQVTDFIFWPSMMKHHFYWGYVRYSGPTDWLVIAAPYLCDLLTFALFVWPCMWLLFRRKWIWLNIVIIGMISPFVNSLYNYWGSKGSRNDVGILFEALPDASVHAYFLITLFIYALGIFLVFRHSASTRFSISMKKNLQRD